MIPALAQRPESTPAAPWVAVSHTHSESLEQHTQQLRDWDLRYDQLDAGRFDGRFTDVRLEGLQIFVEATSRRVRQRGQLMNGSLGIGSMLHGDGMLGLNGMRCDAGSLLLCSATEIDVCTPPDCLLVGLVVDAEQLLETAQSLGALDPQFLRVSMQAVTPPPAVLARWRQVLLHAVDVAVRHTARLDEPGVRRRLRDDLLLTLIDAMSGASNEDVAQPPDQRKRIVDHACELMLSRPDEPPTLLEVCRRVGASPRKLGYCFQDTFGVSPGRYIKTIRLNAVRRELSRTEDPKMSVYDAAARWGFWHFGHFSADYKKLFAELPSETLSRGRAPRAA
ncbi:MAG: helix-turn-helix domain-containing protein [Burkholderiales bacterium]|nr:helix-turn-helix domain-containing protein [Burkholderiales bacterium]